MQTSATQSLEVMCTKLCTGCKRNQFGGKSSTARLLTYFDILADTALRIFIQFPARTVGTSWTALVPVKRWPKAVELHSCQSNGGLYQLSCTRASQTMAYTTPVELHSCQSNGGLYQLSCTRASQTMAYSSWAVLAPVKRLPIAVELHSCQSNDGL